MENNNQKQHLTKSISFIGFLGMGIGCVFGASWLIMSGVWLDTAGGPRNAVIALLLCLLIELPMALAYLEAVPMIPLAGGEMSYSYLAYGARAALIAGWFGVLVNIILCAWESVAMTKMLGFLMPSLKTSVPLYKIGGATVTLPVILIGLVVIVAIGILQYRGTKISARFQAIITGTVLTLVIISSIAGLTSFNTANLQPIATKPLTTGILSLLILLPFSIAGWETIAKGAQESQSGLSRARTGKALVISLVFATFMYIVTLIIPSGILPWSKLVTADVPFATAANATMGTSIFGTLLIVAACFGVIGVYNACFYGATRLMYALSEVGLIPAIFTKLHPKYKTPTAAIIFVSVIVGIAPFIGKAVLIPLIDVASFAYIILWGSTLLSVIRLRKTHPNLKRPVKMPGGMVVGYLGVVVGLLMIFAMLYPKSPAALKWPVEYILLAALLAIGVFLYSFRSKNVTEKERAKLIVGSIVDEDEIDVKQTTNLEN